MREQYDGRPRPWAGRENGVASRGPRGHGRGMQACARGPPHRPADRTAPEVQQPKHSRLGDGLRGAASLAAGLYIYDALTDDSGDPGDSGSSS